MKALAGVTIITGALLAGCGESQATSNVTINQEALKAEVMESESVHDFLITETGAIYVGMLDNGNRRDGFASYVCEVVRSHAEGEGRRLVRIIDVAAVSRGEGFKTLGRHQCDV
ncbi:hypothetical protein [Halomonas llamarensis]|uniref:Uncharacterized protein n=1 Tax=Halomonas llamarensis TaxID=2945104 RepID=A0ABT0SVQ5_9GAMM|nr:hypothetical protein [Halomonas llamarensis]MCL7931731.1 hypothetical protein [Halomonas llamarensis]